MASNNNLTDSQCEESTQENLVFINIDNESSTLVTLESFAPYLSAIEKDVVIEFVDENSDQLIINYDENLDTGVSNSNGITSYSNENQSPNIITTVESTMTLPTSSISVHDVDSIPSQSSTDMSKPPSQNTTASEPGRKKKGRKRKFQNQNRSLKKQKINNNEEYINTKGVIVAPKEFTGENFNCACAKKCTEKLSADIRKAEFEKFWKAGTFEPRCGLLQGNVTEVSVGRHRNSTDKNPREFSRQYKILNTPVCKKTFLNTYQISQSRIDVAIKKNKNQEIQDNRGSGSGKNKISADKIEEIVKFIKLFPKYKSHYCRNNSEGRYLAPNLNLQKLYDIYVSSNEKPVSLSFFKKIFYQKFNLHFKKPQKDTCLRCDTFAVNKQAATGKKLEELELAHKNHLDHAYSLRDQMNKYLNDSKNIPEVEVLTFDLQKTHNLPYIPTSVAYYKRQLNFYNLGIHCGSSGKGIFHTWLEHEAGKGTQEVGSCLRKFILEDLKDTAEHLTLWADSCGGQNRSINMVLMLLHTLLNHHKLKSITLRFLQSGHTYLPNDSEFGDVERALKNMDRLYTDADYIRVMTNCRRKNKFIIKKMKPEDFISIQPLLKSIIIRKDDINKKKISWLQTFEIKLNKDTPHLIEIKSKLSDQPQIINIGKMKKGKKLITLNDIELPNLWPQGKALSSAKISDLNELLKLVPPDCQEFYNFLKDAESADFIDDIEGLGNTLDFAIDPDDEDENQ